MFFNTIYLSTIIKKCHIIFIHHDRANVTLLCSYGVVPKTTT